MAKQVIAVNNKLVAIDNKAVNIEVEEHGLEKHLRADIQFTDTYGLYKTMIVNNVMHTPTNFVYTASSTNNTYSDAIYLMTCGYPKASDNYFVIVRGPSRNTRPDVTVIYNETTHQLTVSLIDTTSTFKGFYSSGSPLCFIWY